ARPLRLLAEHYGKGAEKYDDHNWRKGYDWSLSFAALMRHAWAFWNGEDNDAETGSPHMAAVAFHALAMLEFMHEHPDFDDRWKPDDLINPASHPENEGQDKVLMSSGIPVVQLLADHLGVTSAEVFRRRDQDPEAWAEDSERGAR